MAQIGCSGRFIDALRAVSPPLVKVAMHFALTFLATDLAAKMIADAQGKELFKTLIQIFQKKGDENSQKALIENSLSKIVISSSFSN